MWEKLHNDYDGFEHDFDYWLREFALDCRFFKRAEAGVVILYMNQSAITALSKVIKFETQHTVPFRGGINNYKAPVGVRRQLVQTAVMWLELGIKDMGLLEWLELTAPEFLLKKD